MKPCLLLWLSMIAAGAACGDEGVEGPGSTPGDAPDDTAPEMDDSEARTIDAGTRRDSSASTPSEPDAAPPSRDAGDRDGHASMPGMDSGTSADCTQVTWANPGKVEAPTVTLVPADAGKGKPFGHALGLAEHGYVESEFFFSGGTPAFKSRMLVFRPSDPARFSGTVYVEWFNVSGTMDVPVMWSASQDYFMRAGHVYVGVSAQKSGVDALLNVDEERYRGVTHPGDDAANEIFSMAGAAVRQEPDKILGECLVPKALLAVGQSQSSMRLVNYLSNAAAKHKVYDAIMTHSGGSPPANPPVPNFVIRTMNEGNASSSGPSTVEWDVAAASHNDKRLTEKSFEIIGEAYGFSEIPFTCASPMNDYPAFRVYNAALDWMARWARNGERPPAGKPFEMSGSSFVFDETGNMKGGVRLPDIDVPIKVYKKDNAPGLGVDLFSTAVGVLACGLAGTADPLPPEQLRALYPTHDDYVQKYSEAAERAVRDGTLLQEDADEMIALAAAAAIPD